jgi:hypothetical protein
MQKYIKKDGHLKTELEIGVATSQGMPRFGVPRRKNAPLGTPEGTT